MKSYSQTPLIESRTSQPLLFKMECYQTTGSFKIRGMDAIVANHIANGRRHFVASSGGNAGFSLSYAARLHGGSVKVVVPESTGPRMQDLIRAQGAEVIVHGENWNAADEKARGLVESEGAVYVSPFDDPLLWQGHSTMVDEMVGDLKAQGRPFPKRLVAAVGGGGMLAGIMRGLDRHGLLSQMEIWATETHGAASFHAAVQAGSRVTIDKIDTVATTLGARQVCEEIWNWHLKHPVQTALCSDAAAIAACKWFAAEYGVVVEPSCGSALAAVRSESWVPGETLVIVCGGIGWTFADLEAY